MIDLYIEAIKNRKELIIEYNNEVRTVCPYVYGCLNTGHDAIGAQQFGEPKVFWLSKIQSVTVSNNNFVLPPKPIKLVESTKPKKSIWRTKYQVY